jgi:hypothetical protein
VHRDYTDSAAIRFQPPARRLITLSRAAIGWALNSSFKLDLPVPCSRILAANFGHRIRRTGKIGPAEVSMAIAFESV